MKKLTLMMCAAALAGCASSGVQVSQTAATQFKEGVTTESQIVEKLGNPTTTTIANGIKTITYTGAQYRTNAASFIPIVGLFAGGTDFSVTVAAYQINNQGVLDKVTYSTSGGTARMGSNPAAMQTQEPSAVK
jgi:outer membrane protein assembly factor BamE (lipoprotein component of BamABCDE complex)